MPTEDLGDQFFLALCLPIANRVHNIGPFGICLPGTELLQSLFRMEFSMGSLSWRYRRSLRCLRRFLRSYRGSLWHCHGSLRQSVAAWSAMPIIVRLAKHRKTLLNVVKHHETLVKHCDTSWNIVKHHEPLVNHHETLKALWNIQCNYIGLDAATTVLDAETSALGSAIAVLV